MSSTLQTPIVKKAKLTKKTTSVKSSEPKDAPKSKSRSSSKVSTPSPTTPSSSVSVEKEVSSKVSTPRASTSKAKTVEKEVSTKKKSKVVEPVEVEPVEQKSTKRAKTQSVEKVAKKVNNKPTIADLCGLNLSVAKVKNVISNHCINRETFLVLRELKSHRVSNDDASSFTFSLEGLSSRTIEYLNTSRDNDVLNQKLAYSKRVVKAMDTQTLEDYNVARKHSMQNHHKAQKDTHLFNLSEFDLISFNSQWDPSFYNDFTTTDHSSMNQMELYKYYTDLVNKNKIRFNSESKLFITAFVEHVVKQLVTNGVVSCIHSGKKILQLEHALDRSVEGYAERFPLSPIVSNLTSYKRVMEEMNKPADSSMSEEVKAPESEESADLRHPFKYYISELCRDVRMELSKHDLTVKDPSESVYNSTSISKSFKLFCSDVVVELLETLGSVLRTEVSARNIKTINYNTINALLSVYHTLYNVESQFDATVGFIQDRYCRYNSYLKTRHAEKSSKKVVA